MINDYLSTNKDDHYKFSFYYHKKTYKNIIHYLIKFDNKLYI